MNSVVGDLRYAVRTLARDRGFAAVALATVALGVGVNTAVFSVVNAALLRPLPFPESDRLIAIHEIDRRSPGEHRPLSYPTFLDWQNAMRTVEGMAAYSGYPFSFELGDTTERVEAARVSWNYLEVMGVRPLIGRGLAPGDAVSGAAPVVVISDALWSRFFNRDPSAIGRVVRLNETAATVVGVVPDTFAPPDTSGIQDVAQLWAPLGVFMPTGSLSGRGAPFISPVVARLRPGVTTQQAQQEIDVVAAELERQYPENRDRGAVIVPIADQYFGRVRPVLLILFGAVSIVLSIACANLAGLLLARGDARARELAVRAALGAARGRIARMVLVESLTISLVGGALGLLLAAWLIDVLLALSPVSLPVFVRVAIDVRVLAFAFAVCATSGVVFGLAPAIVGSRTDVVEALKRGGGRAGGGSPFLRRRLVTMEIAIAIVLVIGAGLMVRTLDRLRAFDPGFDLDGLLAITVSVPPAALGNQAAPRTDEFMRGLLERVRALPGVREASLTWDVPLTDVWLQNRVQLPDRDVEPVLVRRHTIAPGYFRAMGIPLFEGRDFAAGDAREAGLYTAVISRRMAERYWPGRSAIHQRLLYNKRAFEIVGVAGDVQHERLLEPESADPDVYFSIYQMTLMRGLTLVLRTDSDPESVATAVRQTVETSGGGWRVWRARTGEDIFAAQVVRQRFMGVLLGVFSLMALVLTLVGVYGVAAYNAGRQVREIGVRLALGASSGDVLRTLVKAEAPSILQGILAGVAGSMVVTGTLSALLHGVSPTDPATFGAAAAVVALVATLACAIPARAAAAADPIVALRSE
jgi:predicted permease